MVQREWKRRRVLVDARFQAVYTTVIVGVAALILAVLGSLYVRTLGEQRRLVGINRICPGQAAAAGDTLDAEFDRDLRDRLERDDTVRVLAMVTTAMVLVTALAYVGLRLTFRVAGPAKAVSVILQGMAEGRLDFDRHLRKGDQFRFLEEDLLRLREALLKEAGADAALLDEVAHALGRTDLPPSDRDALVRRVQEAAGTKRNRLGSGREPPDRGVSPPGRV